MPSKLRAPQESGEIGRVIQKVYDDINSVIENINTDLEGLKEPAEESKSGSIAVVKEGTSYSLRGKTADGWAKVSIKLLDSASMKKIFDSNKFNDIDDISSSSNITTITDNTTGTAADIIPDAGTWSNAEIDNAVASLAAKINALIPLVSKANELVTVSNIHNDRINTLINKVNDIIRRID